MRGTAKGKYLLNRNIQLNIVINCSFFFHLSISSWYWLTAGMASIWHHPCLLSFLLPSKHGRHHSTLLYWTQPQSHFPHNSLGKHDQLVGGGNHNHGVEDSSCLTVLSVSSACKKKGTLGKGWFILWIHMDWSQRVVQDPRQGRTRCSPYGPPVLPLIAWSVSVFKVPHFPLTSNWPIFSVFHSLNASEN